ncbi:hypothetical protein FLONG3_7655 [Fusarium longipes]|uniref:BZIP domain-containing protein n=1 Tax=Fusarium longipes TaxID=694270 RepID=A0A395SCW2_9HYPO|nr:hypothetical protein FLONG3_7655 [Fusarium longipes]
MEINLFNNFYYNPIWPWGRQGPASPVLGCFPQCSSAITRTTTTGPASATANIYYLLTPRNTQRCENYQTRIEARIGPFDPGDNNTANTLFMLAHGRDGARSLNQFAVASGAPGHAYLAPVAPQNRNTPLHVSRVNGDSISSARGMSDGSIASDVSEQAKLNIRGKGNRNPSAANGQRRADEPLTRVTPNKKSKTNAAAINSGMNFSDESKTRLEDSGDKLKRANEENRKNFLERNRIAAFKCRQRKKQWLSSLQTKVEMFDTENDALTVQVSRLKEEALNLKTLLFAHQDCPVSQQQRLYSASILQVVGPFNPQIDLYGLAAPMPNEVMAGQSVQQRFS